MDIRKSNRTLEKQLRTLAKQEERLAKRALQAAPPAWKSKLEEKIPAKASAALEAAFVKAFALVFEKGTGIIEKSYDRKAIQTGFTLRQHAMQVRGSRQDYGAFRRERRGPETKNLLFTTAEGVGLGLLGIGLPDLVLFVGMLLKGVYETALHYGFSYDSPQERYWILQLLQTSLTKGEDWQTCHDKVCQVLPDGLPEPTPEQWKQQLDAAARTFALDMLLLKFIQGLPLVGVLGGAGNPVYYRRVMRYVQLIYYKRYLLQRQKGK